jgi:hypothetical protein
LAGEVVVDLVEIGVQARPLVVAETMEGGEHEGMVAHGEVVVANAQPSGEPVDHGLARGDVDRPGDRARFGNEDVSPHRDEVPTGGSHVAH